MINKVKIFNTFEYICNFCKRMLFNLTYVLIYSLTINISLCQIWFLRNLQNIQCDFRYKSGLLNVINEGITHFQDFCFDIDSYSVFHWFEVIVGKNIKRQACLYVLSYSSLFPWQGPKSNVHYVQKIYAEKHNGVLTLKSGVLVQLSLMMHCKKNLGRGIFPGGRGMSKFHYHR